MSPDCRPSHPTFSLRPSRRTVATAIIVPTSQSLAAQVCARPSARRSRSPSLSRRRPARVLVLLGFGASCQNTSSCQRRRDSRHAFGARSARWSRLLWSRAVRCARLGGPAPTCLLLLRARSEGCTPPPPSAGIKKQACINRKCLLMVPRDEDGERAARKRAKQRQIPPTVHRLSAGAAMGSLPSSEDLAMLGGLPPMLHLPPSPSRTHASSATTVPSSMGSPRSGASSPTDELFGQHCSSKPPSRAGQSQRACFLPRRAAAPCAARRAADAHEFAAARDRAGGREASAPPPSPPPRRPAVARAAGGRRALGSHRTYDGVDV